MRTVLLTLLVLLLASTAVFAFSPAVDADFDAQVAAEAPELFSEETTNDVALSLDEAPETAFAELDAALEEHAESESESESENESESESESESEAESESESESEESMDEDAAMLETESEESKNPDPWHRDNKKQPVARNNAKITCIDGDCVRGRKVHKVKPGSNPLKQKKKKTKLQIALAAVKEEIMVRVKKLHQEKDWSKKVATLIDEYQQKLAKVTGNISHLRSQTKALLRKKKQIQNVQIQGKLRYKLQLAQEDLKRLQKQMEHIAGKEHEFSDTEKQLKGTMAQLKNSLLRLRGQDVPRLAKEGIH